MPDKADGFLRLKDPTTGRPDRVAWYGPLDLERIELLHRHVGDVPAPWGRDSHRGAAPRDFIRARIGLGDPAFRRSDVRLRHCRSFSDWVLPAAWPLLADVHTGRSVDLYHADFAIVPSQVRPTAEQLAFFYGASCWSAWCRTADELGFVGVETNQGYEPFMVVFGSSASRRLRDAGLAPFAAAASFLRSGWFPTDYPADEGQA